MKIVLTTEIYPPWTGGAGWSTRALALGLRSAGHDVQVVTTSPGPANLDGLVVERLKADGHKRLQVPRLIGARLRDLEWDVVHAQHSLSAVASIPIAGARTAVTIRDHWPVCFWSTRISRGQVCPGCGWLPMSRCVTGNVQAPAPLSWGAIPYMRLDLREKLRALGRSGANLAVSESVARELRAASVPRVETIPNIVDAEETVRTGRAEPSFQLPDRYLLFVGKLEENKGARALVRAVAAARTGLPLVVLGEGTLQHQLKVDAARLDVELVVRGWASREDVLATMARATVLVFPSLWPEPLSRVLLEAIALGVPIAAVNTGGSDEILTHDESGLLVDTSAELSAAVARLAGDDALRQRLAEGARQRAAAFAPEALVPRYEAVYSRLGG